MKKPYIGFNPPFLGGPLAVFSPQTGERLLQNDIMQLLLTSPGERVYRPTFGTAIRGTLFELNSSGVQFSIRSSIIQALEQWEDRVTINSVTVTPMSDNNDMQIVVNVSPTYNPQTSFTVELVLPGQS